MARDPFGSVRKQEHGHVGDVGLVTGSTERRVIRWFTASHTGNQSVGALSAGDQTGRYDIASNTSRTFFDGEDLAQCVHASFRSRYMSLPWETTVMQRGRDVNVTTL